MQDLPLWLKHGTVWLLLGATLFLALQAWQARDRRTRFSIAGNGAVEIQRGRDGHYHWPGRVAGRAVEFVVDTGASSTAIPADMARELGLTTHGTVRSNTAGGMVDGALVRTDIELAGGVRVRRLTLVALPGLTSPLLGMDVLARLRWTQGAGALRVEQTPGAAP